jgi:hypothetical protein
LRPSGEKGKLVPATAGRVFVEQKHKLAPYETPKKYGASSSQILKDYSFIIYSTFQ